MDQRHTAYVTIQTVRCQNIVHQATPMRKELKTFWRKNRENTDYSPIKGFVHYQPLP